MKKIAIYSLVLLFAGFLACKKDTGPTPPPEPSARYKALTSHYWRLVHLWRDTSQAAKSNPSSVPLPTTYDANVFQDSCKYFTGFYHKIDGKAYYSTGKHCGCNTNAPCLSLYCNWYLLDNDNTIKYCSSSTYTILQLDDNVFSYYTYDWYNINKKLVSVYVYKPYTDW